MVGATIAHYQIIEKLGEGGMGVVYRAHDLKLDRDVAIKVLSASTSGDALGRARLLREARTAAALNHTNICTIHEVGEIDGRAYIAMELVEGEPLSRRLAQRALPPDQALRCGLELADALAHAHERGVVHRDLKSANVVVTTDGRVKILDFGLAKRLAPDSPADATTASELSIARPGVIAGTLAYMAPELLRGQPADARSDIWALGLILYEMAAGQRPFQGTTGFEMTAAIMSADPLPLPQEVPDGLRAVIARCLRKEPLRRYQRASEVRASLEAVRSGARTTPGSWRARWSRRRWMWVTGSLLLSVAAALGARWWRPSPIASIAVLPLKNLSRDPGQDYFSDGLTEELITQLTKIAALRVIPRASAMRYKATERPLRQIARELNVEAMLEGSVLRVGNRVRITAQLIEAGTEKNLWADSYERDLRDVLTLQAEVARAIARQVRVAVTPDEMNRLTRVRPVEPDAYEAYLKGRSHLWNLTDEGFDAAMEYFQYALGKDPRYALAHLGVGMLWAARSNIGDLPPREGWPKARSAALKALEQDDTLGEAHHLLAVVLAWYEWDWPGAEREFQRALETDPHNADARQNYSLLLASTGRREEAMNEAQRCLELDSRSARFQDNYGISLSYLGRSDEAIARWQKLASTDPDYRLVHGHLWEAFHKKGMYDQALAEATEYYSGPDADGEGARWLRDGYARGGYAQAMHAAAEWRAGRAKTRYLHATSVARLYAFGGEKDRALDWLERAYEQHDSQLIYLHFSHSWDSLRSEPRFEELLRRLKLPLN